MREELGSPESVTGAPMVMTRIYKDGGIEYINLEDSLRRFPDYLYSVWLAAQRVSHLNNTTAPCTSLIVGGQGAVTSYQ